MTRVRMARQEGKLMLIWEKKTVAYFSSYLSCTIRQQPPSYLR